MTPVKEVITDLTGFGGLPIFILSIIILWFIDLREWALLFFIGLAACYVIAITIRLTYFKKRPDKSKVRKHPWYLFVLDRIGQSSFPSLHGLRVTTLSILSMFLFNNFYVYIVLSLLIVLVGWSRIYLKRHYPVDVIAGVLFGILISYGVLWLPVWLF